MAGRTIFLTGGSGFIGSSLLARLSASQRYDFVCLAREGGVDTPGVRWLRAGLEEREKYAPALRGCEQVVHLAALTGKARAKAFERVNVEGTRSLLDACREAGVRRFLHVSTIAVTFPEKRHYPYARSKERAEGLVRGSGLDWSIVRPTVVLGRDSPIWRSLATLARLPRTPIFGSGKANLQPILVEDLAACIASWMEAPNTNGETVEMGGPDVLTFEDLLRRTRHALGKRSRVLIHLPLAMTVKTLALLERPLLRLLPMTAGQLYAFRYDSVARPSAFMDELRPNLASVDKMLELLSRDG
jgi:nucleoside-diphosphate-sugar epimerase